MEGKEEGDCIGPRKMLRGASRSPVSESLDEGDAEEEEVVGNTVLQLSLHSAPYTHSHKLKFPELCKNFSAVAWCGRTNIIACATETCARDPWSNLQPSFWIPIHIVDPERPTEHAVFNVIADSPCDSVQSIEWSPNTCLRALLVANLRGRVTIWTQPSQVSVNVVRSFNCWMCEYEWRQDQAVVTKWLTGVSPYRLPSYTSSSASNLVASIEEKFLAHQPRASARWPNIVCACTVLSDGCVQLRWRQWPSSELANTPKWFSTSKGVLGAGPSGIYVADVTVSEAGAVLVAGSPIGNPSTVVVWEVSPWGLASPNGNQQLLAKFATGGQSSSLTFGAPSWPGMAPMAAYLLSWQEHSGQDLKSVQSQYEIDEKDGPLLQCSPVSNLSAYVSPEASSQVSTGWGSGVGSIAFDPSRGGSALFVVVVEGYYLYPRHPDEGPSLTGWKFQRWESSRQQVAIHPLFETGNANYAGSFHPMTTTWTAVINKSFPPTRGVSNSSSNGIASGMESVYTKSGSFDMKGLEEESSGVVKCIAKASFSGHGGEICVTLVGGQIYVFSGTGFVPSEDFVVPVEQDVAATSFSATGCCMCSVWHDNDEDCTVLKIIRVQPPPPTGVQGGVNGLTWERHLADRFWWSLVVEADWWDVIASTQSAADANLVYMGKVAAVLDADFHGLPTSHRQHYGPALDRIKCRMLEGHDAADLRALVLDMQARLLLEMLGKGIEAALMNPATLIAEPWQAPSETLTGLGGDAMVVDPALVPNIQSYVDAVLDLASHFLTRLRRYASFCRTLATHAVASASPSTSGTRPAGANASIGATVPPGQANNGGTAQVKAWVQGAIAKISNSADGGASSVPTSINGPSPPLSLTVSTATFPGIPAVRLVGDCYFIHRLCQLLLFCLVFRKRQLPRYIGAPKGYGDTNIAGKLIPSINAKAQEEASVTSGGTRSTQVQINRTEENQIAKSAQSIPATKAADDPSNARSQRVGSGNAGQGYTSEEVKFLFLVLVDLCKRTSSLPHPLPKPQTGTSSPSFRLHYIDGQYSVAPEVVEASLGPHMQSLPRPRGADAAGLLMRELELHPPAEEWNKRNLSGGPWSSMDEYLEETSMNNHIVKELWPRKRRFAERDAACGLRTAVGMGSFTSFLGSRRDVITAAWRAAFHGVWHKCMRCGRQTASFAPSSSADSQAIVNHSRDSWWAARWLYACPMCGGHWFRIV
ncbi:hypothetical protein O6H91_03G030900 [Diphasiastrum complanatum]|uniref:Uncharacterized protein n=1 Tax=Diphasiastrum complanatum TaxID=34168 RepID=A0ACC2E4K9_DIPCM|nr:hypothetical protein O6H91_03G030900 [Diphasiastrum complanatum]